jgi:Rrf2 family transcriptional regulator, iron-sulfur cluster assembly transcription factor
MQLTLGKRADYAIRATVDLARHYGNGARRKSREIADEMAIPLSFLPQILAELVRDGIVTSVAGPGGGYSLARPPSEVSLLDVVQAVEGEFRSTECVLRGGPCRWDDVCAVHVPWSRAQLALVDELGRTSFAQIAEIDASLEAGTYALPEELRSRRP